MMGTQIKEHAQGTRDDEATSRAPSYVEAEGIQRHVGAFGGQTNVRCAREADSFPALITQAKDKC